MCQLGPVLTVSLVGIPLDLPSDGELAFADGRSYFTLRMIQADQWGNFLALLWCQMFHVFF